MRLVSHAQIESSSHNIPEEMTVAAEEYGVSKARKASKTTFSLAVTAGVFIGIAFVFYTTVTTGAANAPWGFTHLVGGVAFSLGLIFIVVCGGELFTSTVLTTVARASGVINNRQMLAVWVKVYFGNMLGAGLLVILVSMAKLHMLDGGMWGLNALTIAQHKLHHTFLQAFALGVLCNILVCLAIWMTFSTKDMLTKSFLVILPVAMFVSTGFEHSVANMFMVPMGIAIKTFAEPEFWSQINVAPEAFADLNFYQFVTANLIPVTLGNIVGGGLFIGLGYWTIYRKPQLSTLKGVPSTQGQPNQIQLTHNPLNPVINLHSGEKNMNTNFEAFEVRSHMQPATLVFQQDVLLQDAIDKLIETNEIGGPVIDKHGRLVGYLSEQDILRELWNQDFVPKVDKCVADVMEKELTTFTPYDSLIEIAEYMAIDKESVYPVNQSGYLLSYSDMDLESRTKAAKVHRPKSYPVVTDGLLVGIISRHHVLKAFRSTFAEATPA
ncbi:formate transporter FocA [Aliivibrio sp.]|uniref:formate transporter FocA n=1 Tax=Aliivibrio sp. TaxID=1872443 RepID=UPI003D2EFF9A